MKNAASIHKGPYSVAACNWSLPRAIWNEGGALWHTKLSPTDNVTNIVHFLECIQTLDERTGGMSGATHVIARFHLSRDAERTDAGGNALFVPVLHHEGDTIMAPN
jgi:hypothetical protein